MWPLQAAFSVLTNDPCKAGKGTQAMSEPTTIVARSRLPNTSPQGGVAGDGVVCGMNIADK